MDKNSQKIKRAPWKLAAAKAQLRRDFNRELLNVPRPLGLDGSVPFVSVQQVLVPSEGGVYLFHDLRGVLYIGRTCDLQRRFGEHYEIAGNELLRRATRRPFGQMAFSWVLLNVEVERAQLEHELVTWLQPPCNRVTPGPMN